MAWRVPYLNKGCKSDFNNGLGGDSDSSRVLPPCVYLSPTPIMASFRTTAVLCQMKCSGLLLISTVPCVISFEFFVKVIFLADSIPRGSNGNIWVWFEFFKPKQEVFRPTSFFMLFPGGKQTPIRNLASFPLSLCP